MSRTNNSLAKFKQVSFVGGELGQNVGARFDLEAFSKGAAALVNFMPSFTGGITSRPGFDLKAVPGAVKDMSYEDYYLTSFIPSQTEVYLALFCREDIYIYDCNKSKWFAPVKYNDLPINYPIDPQKLNCCQSNDILIYTNPLMRPRILERYVESDTIKFRSKLMFDRTNPYTAPPMGLSVKGINPKFTKNSETSYTVEADKDFFVNKHIGSFMYVKLTTTGEPDPGTHQFYFYMDEYVDPKHMKIIPVDCGNYNTKWPIERPLPDKAFYIWSVGAYDGSEKSGYVWPNYPTACYIHNTRLYLAGISDAPQVVYGSYVNDWKFFAYLNEEGQTDNECAFTFFLDQTQNNSVEWITSYQQSLIVGTSYGEYGAAATDGFLCASNCTVTKLSTTGSTNTPPVLCHNKLVFVSRYGQRVKQMSFELATESFIPFDLMYLNDTLTDNNTTIIDIGWQQYPDYILWAIRSDGVLLGLTFVPDQNIMAWHEHTSFVRFRQLTVVPGKNRDEAYLMVETISGKTAMMSMKWSRFSCLFPEEGTILDGSVLLSKAFKKGDKLTGLGEMGYTNITLGLRKGTLGGPLNWHPNVSVIDGEVTIPEDCSQVYYGQMVEGIFESMDINTPAGDGFMQMKRVQKLYLRFQASDHVYVSADGKRWESCPWDYENNGMPKIFTGDKSIEVMGDTHRQARIYIKSAAIKPINILGIRADIEVGEE